MQLSDCLGAQFLGVMARKSSAAEFGDGLQHGEDNQPQPHVVRAVKFLKEDIRKYGKRRGALAARQLTGMRQQ